MGTTAAGDGPGVAQILHELVQIANGLAGRPVSPRAGLMASGLTSKNLVTLLATASDRWRVEIPVEVLFDGGDLTSLTQHIHQSIQSAGSDRPTGTASRPRQSAAGSAEDRRRLRTQIRAAIGDTE